MAVDAGHICFSIKIHGKFIPVQVSRGINRKLATRQVEVFCLTLSRPDSAEAKHYILVLYIQEVVLCKLHAALSSFLHFL